MHVGSGSRLLRVAAALIAGLAAHFAMAASNVVEYTYLPMKKATSSS